MKSADIRKLLREDFISPMRLVGSNGNVWGLYSERPPADDLKPGASALVSQLLMLALAEAERRERDESSLAAAGGQ